MTHLSIVAQAQADTEVVRKQGIKTTVVAAAVTLADGGTEPAIQVRRFIGGSRASSVVCTGLQRMVLVVGDEEVGLGELTDEHLAKVVE